MGIFNSYVKLPEGIDYHWTAKGKLCAAPFSIQEQRNLLRKFHGRIICNTQSMF